MKMIVLDFETFYSKKDFSLSKMATEAYIRDPRFEVIGVSAMIDGGSLQWFSGSRRETRNWLLGLCDWSDTLMLAHNNHFDGAILNWHFGIKPKGYLDTLSMANALHGINESVSLKSLAERYFLPAKGTEVNDADGKRRADFTPEELQAYGKYCMMDTWLCQSLFELMSPRFTKAELKAIDITIRMFVEPVLDLDLPLLKQHLIDVREEQKESLTRLAGALGAQNEEDVKTALMSNAKFASLLEYLGVDPPKKISPMTGKETYAFAKTDEGFTALLDHENLTVQAAVAARIGNKTTIEESRTEAFIGVATRGAFPFPLKYSGAAVTHRWCLTGDHEVLTSQGWVHIEEWAGGDIAQWDFDFGVQMLPAKHVLFEYTGPMRQVSARYKSMCTTPDHRIPGWSGKTGRARITRAKDIRNQILPVSGNMDNAGVCTRIDAQIAAMYQADGHRMEGNYQQGIRFRFSRARKIERFRMLMAEAELSYVEHHYISEPTVTVFIVRGSAQQRMQRYVAGVDKQFLWSLVNESTRESLSAFISEVRYWDGHISKKTTFGQYCSTHKGNAELVATVAHLTGLAATIKHTPRGVEGWADSYTVHIRNNKTTHLDSNEFVDIQFSGVVHCAETKTGFFLTRHNGLIHVTGNSGFDYNVQNMGRGSALRRSIKAPKGYKIVAADLSNIELRLGLYLAGQEDKLQLIREGRDLYIDIATHIFGKSYEEIEELGKKSKERTTGKVVSLSSIYGTGAAKLKDTLRIQGKVKVSQEEAQRMTDLYRGTYTEVVSSWHQGKDVLDAIYAKQYYGEYLRPGILQVTAEGIMKPSGLLLAYPDLAWTYDLKALKWGYTYEQKRKMRDRVYPAKCYQRCVQSLARDIIAEHMLKIDKRYLVVGTVHDEVICLVAEDEVEEANKFILEVMRTPPVWAPGLPLDAEIGVGDNYGDAK